MTKNNILSTLTMIIMSCAFLTACGGDATKVSRDSSDLTVEVPDFTLTDLEGAEVTLSSFAGKSPVLLFFWATWCPYCMEEFPNIMALSHRYRGSLEVIGIDVAESRDKVRAYMKSKGFDIRILLDRQSAVTTAFGVEGLPTLVLINREGRGVIAANRLSDPLRRKIDEVISQ